MRAVGVILALTLAMGSIAFSASPALAALPEASLDSFVPGAGVDTLAPLKLKAGGAGTSLQGKVAWDGYRLDALVRTGQGRIRSASLKGALDNGLMGMILSAMEEKGFVPVAMACDGTSEQNREAAVEAMAQWADGGTQDLHLLFLPEKAFQRAKAASKANPKAQLGALLKPCAGEKAYGLALFRRDDSFTVYIGTVEDVGRSLKLWK
ncbi:MAG: hypothetical protein IIY31_06370 [Desulfovibrio sp.]|jgi:hypothetical protein|nr:hypothetical protein [Desulfovibrio sp.]MBQ1420363.1 hypothetical protein [Desulfovibrio sp.]MBQ1844983.1 hypothetical protein [Desulfovibrio sp.]MBQ2476979.1 hypothetical protein [Desulfovibrio sp.]MBQ2516395.1 hypothetical protein [Desulfovibrio sp.]